MGRRRSENPSPKTLRNRAALARKKEREAAARAERLENERRKLAERPASPAEVCEWIERKLIVPTGPLGGQPFRLPDWQKEWIAGAMAPGKREAGLSIARKNGKSGLIGAVCLAALAGPLNRTGWRGVVTSLRGSLAKELRDAIMLTARASRIHTVKLHKSPPPGVLYGAMDSRIDFLAADRATGHALGADLALIDEAGLLDEGARGLWNALYSSISGRNGRFWAISIQGDGPMFAEMEARAEAGDARLHWRKWATPMPADPERIAPHEDIFNEEAWLLGNPGLADGIKSLEYMADNAERVKMTPGNEMHFRAWDLNQPVDPERQVIVALNEYRQCVAPDAPDLEGDIVLGVDLGGSVSMTAATAWCPATGAIKCYGAFGDDPPLSVRARADRMGSQYDRMLRDGELRLYDGKVTPVVPFLRDVMADVGARGRIIAIGADRYRKAEAEMAFRDAGIPPTRCFWRGQGASATADGSHDVRAFQKAVARRFLKTRGSLMLEAAIASSVLRFDNSGNPALDKAANNARIDALSAAVIAVGIGDLIPQAPLFADSGLHIV